MPIPGGAGTNAPSVITASGPDGAVTVVHDFGGTGPVVLFAHATGMHGRIWKPVADHLVDRAHCVAVDLRGHGDSGLPAGADLAWDAFGRDVLAAVGAVGGGPVIGVGHSLGGAALLMAAVARPGEVDRLFLYEPAVHAGFGGHSWDKLVMLRDAMVEMTGRRRATFASRADALENFVRKPPMEKFHAAVLGEYVGYGFAERSADVNSGVVLKCLPEIEARIYSRSYDHDLGECLDAIKCPVTFASGSETDDLQRRSTELLATRFGTAPVILPGVDHFGPLQQPRQFAEVVARHVLDA
jgi:pimeloyl-ACP methyl ester carboxylesterase